MAKQTDIELLTEIRDMQKEQLELQRQHFAFVKKQYDRAERIQDKTESLQNKAHLAMKIVMPLIILVLGFLIFLMLQF